MMSFVYAGLHMFHCLTLTSAYTCVCLLNGDSYKRSWDSVPPANQKTKNYYFDYDDTYSACSSRLALFVNFEIDTTHQNTNQKWKISATIPWSVFVHPPSTVLTSLESTFWFSRRASWDGVSLTFTSFHSKYATSSMSSSPVPSSIILSLSTSREL